MSVVAFESEILTPTGTLAGEPTAAVSSNTGVATASILPALEGIQFVEEKAAEVPQNDTDVAISIEDDPQFKEFYRDVTLKFDFKIEFDNRGSRQGTNITLSERAIPFGNTAPLNLPRDICPSVLDSIIFNENMTITEFLNPQYRYFNACTALTNLTDDIDLFGEQLPKNFTDTLKMYSITNKTEDKAKAWHVTSAAGFFLLSMCELSDCAEKNKFDHCAIDNLFLNPTFETESFNSIVPVEPPIMSFDNFNGCQANICKKSKAFSENDPDIGGIGVFSSYVFQLIIAIILILLGAFEWFATICQRHKTKQRKQISYMRSHSYRFLLKSFHKTQIFFIAAIVVAAFFKSRSNSISTVNGILLYILTLNGIVLLSFVLMTVFYLDKKSYYLYWMTMVAFMLCLVFLILTLQIFEDNAGKFVILYVFCQNYFHDPKAFGSTPQRQNGLVDFLGLSVGIPKAVIILIIVWCCLVMTALFIYLTGIWGQVTPTWFVAFWKRNKFVLNGIAGFFILLIYGAQVGLNAFLLYYFFQIVDGRTWGFGQIIAAVVWVPVILDFLNEQLHEYRKGRVGVKENTVENYGYGSDEGVVYNIPIIINEKPSKEDEYGRWRSD